MSTRGTKQALSKLSIDDKPPPPVVPFWLDWPYKSGNTDRWSVQLSSQETVTITLGYEDKILPTDKKEFIYNTFATFPFIYFKNKHNLDAINTNIPYDTKAIKLPWKGPADEDLNDVLRVCKPVYEGLDRYLRGRLGPEISIVFRCKDLETGKTIAIRIGNKEGKLKGREEELIDKDIRTLLAKTPDCRKWNLQSTTLVYK